MNCSWLTDDDMLPRYATVLTEVLLLENAGTETTAGNWPIKQDTGTTDDSPKANSGEQCSPDVGSEQFVAPVFT